MKIVLLSSRFYPHIGGVEKVIDSLAENLSVDNEVVVLTSMDSNKNNYFGTHEEIVVEKSYKVKRVWMNLPRSVFGFLLFPYRLFRGVYRLVAFFKSYQPNIINFHFPDDVSIYLWFALLFYKAPLVINIHGNDLHRFSKKFLYRPFIESLIEKSNSIIVNSEYMKSEFLQMNPFKLYASKVHVIPNGLDLQNIQKIKSKKYVENDYLFFVGRFVFKKGIDLLVNAFADIDVKNLSLVLEGNGEEFENIEKLIKKKGLENKIFMTKGKLSEDDKSAYMKASLMGVIPSRIEPFGIVALEYLACGVPLVSSNTGGLVSILKNDKTCLFFESENVNDLKAKIRKLIESPALRKKLVENGLQEVKKYSWEEVHIKYLDLYNLALNQ